MTRDSTEVLTPGTKKGDFPSSFFSPDFVGSQAHMYRFCPSGVLAKLTEGGTEAEKDKNGVIVLQCYREKIVFEQRYEMLTSLFPICCFVNICSSPPPPPPLFFRNLGEFDRIQETGCLNNSSGRLPEKAEGLEPLILLHGHLSQNRIHTPSTRVPDTYDISSLLVSRACQF